MLASSFWIDCALCFIADGTDEVMNLCYIEVEKSCRQKLQQWEKDQEKHKEMNRAALNAHKAVLEREIKEQDEKRENWKKKFEKERLKLNTLQQVRQNTLEILSYEYWERI